jgi:NAD(P)-dependent dehydrogenase (short-subunit alcohol dehydrogenase family)
VFSLDGSVVLVTGAAAGIGAATVHRLHAAGARVVALDIDPLPDDVRASCALGLVADVSKDDEVRAGVTATLEELSRIDAVVNNAGVSPSDHDVVDDSDAAYLRAFRVNVLGALHVTRAAASQMQAGSSIVNIASLSALMGAPGLGAYASSKAALVELTRTSALELAGRGIRVNAIAPSGVDTQMLAGDSDVVRRERAWIDAAAAIPRLITPDEVAACIHFLVAPESSAITGQCLVVDGGIGAGPTPALLDRLDRPTGPV